MLNFKKVELSDRQQAVPFLQALPYRLYDHSFVCHYIWQETYPISYAWEEGVLYIRYSLPEETIYQMPLCAGDRLAEAVEKLRADAAEQGVDFAMIAVNAEMKAELEAALPGKLSFEESPDQADYMYEVEALRELRGKKLHGKRNFVNRFRATYEGEYEIVPLTAADGDEVLAFEEKWIAARGADEDFHREAVAIRRAFDAFEELGMTGVALRLKGEIIAFALGSRINGDTILEDFEKAMEIPGAYQTINQAFMQYCGEGYTYVNREEDMGIEGLRKAKLSYAPAYLNMRYRVTFA
ncbi:MAG: DUF2156 domain-containing protein [Ruminococcaceae bacterium]|nr:DUF2156 domain-containing protein [Oscillospiraceae bacterium]